MPHGNTKSERVFSMARYVRHLSKNRVFAKEEAGRTLGAALASMKQLCELSVSSCHLSKKSLRHFLDGLSRGCPRLTSLDLGGNDVFAKEEAGRTLGAALASMEQLGELNLSECRLSKKSLRHFLDGLSRGCPRLTSLNLYSCRLTDSSFKHVVNGICRGPGCQQLVTLSYRGNKLTSAGSEETTRGLLTQRPDLEIEADGCDLSLLNRRRLRNEFGNRFIWF
ncbi:hypothetical protein LSAT2_009578 [Lamellibrachia satsuma]|nr:hypothetical protein LSAT2_009578 [Lamellibrachia satsuma]